MFSLKNILKASSVYTLLGFLPTASRIFLLPIFLLYLKPSEFALIGLNTIIASILPLVMTLGLENAFTRYYFDYKREPQLLKSYLSTIIIFIIINSLLVTLIILPFGTFLLAHIFKSKEFTFYPFGFTAVISAIFSAVASVYVSYMRNKQDLKNFTFYSLSLFIFSTASETIAIIIFHANASGVILVKLVITGLITSFFIIRLLIDNGIYFNFRFLKNSFQYALPLVPYTAFGLVFLYFDRVLIENKLNLESLAVYNVAMSIANITDSFMFAIQMATYPIIYELLKKNANANLDKISQTYRFIGVIVLLTMSILIAASPPVIIQFLKASYIPAIRIIPIILISYSFRFFYIVYAEPLFFFKKTKYLPWLTVISGTVSIVSNILLIPLFGIVGAAASSVFAKIAQFIPAYYLYIKINTLRFKLSYIFILTTGVFFISGILFVYFKQLLINKIILYFISFSPVIFITAFIYYKFLKHSGFKIFKPTLNSIKEIF